MTVQELYDSMSYQFKSVSNQIDTTVFTEILNMAVKQLALDVPIFKTSVDIQLYDTTNTYALPINLTQIKQVYDSDGLNRPINREGDLMSVFQTGYESLEVPYPLNGVVLTVSYYYTPAKLALTDKIPFQDTLFSALQYFILFKTITNFATGQNGQLENYNYLRYKAEIKNFFSNNDFIQDEFVKDYNSFDSKGWI